MGWTEVWQYSKLVKCPLENQYFASYIAIAAVYFERICTTFSCCQSDRPDFAQPTFCFERNGCFGLQWLGRNACSARLINSIGVTLESTKDQIRRKAPTQDGGFIRIHNTRPKK